MSLPTAFEASSIDGVSDPARSGALALPEMVPIPAGDFWMGANAEEDKFASVLELPRRLVRIEKAFYAGKHPVTFAQYDAFAAATPYAHVPDDRGWGRGNLPVVNVNWDDAEAYVTWLRQVTGQAYRLLSEAEWEYCCRAGSTGVFSTGNQISTTQANFLYLDFERGILPGIGRPMPVGSYPANAMGLHDMHGNVCELVADAWHDHYESAPCDGSAWAEPYDTVWRVSRGGGWDGLPRILRCAFRDWVRHDQRLDNMGFRVARDI